MIYSDEMRVHTLAGQSYMWLKISLFKPGAVTPPIRHSVSVSLLRTVCRSFRRVFIKHTEEHCLWVKLCIAAFWSKQMALTKGSHHLWSKSNSLDLSTSIELLPGRIRLCSVYVLPSADISANVIHWTKWCIVSRPANTLEMLPFETLVIIKAAHMSKCPWI